MSGIKSRKIRLDFRNKLRQSIKKEAFQKIKAVQYNNKKNNFLIKLKKQHLLLPPPLLLQLDSKLTIWREYKVMESFDSVQLVTLHDQIDKGKDHVRVKVKIA